MKSYHACYTHEPRDYTNVPQQYHKLCKMYNLWNMVLVGALGSNSIMNIIIM